MKDHYPSEKFWNAARTLAISSERLRRRVADAFSYSLVHLSPGHKEVLGDIGRKLNDYEAVWDRIKAAGPQGTIRAWADGLTNDEAGDVAEWIFDTAFELEREYWKDA